MNRRELLGFLGGAALAARLPLGAPDSRHTAAKLGKIGLQLYTTRRELARDFEGTLAAIAGIGYREAEFAGYFGKPLREVRAVLDRHALAAPSAHVPIEALSHNWEGVLEDAHVIGHRYLVVAWIPAAARNSLDDYKRVAELFNRAGVEASAAGVRFAYHNHDFEFAPLTGRVPYDVLLGETDPASVAFEMDLYWITKGGGDPLAYFAAHPGRFPMVHVKDMDATPARDMTDVGRGTIDWRQIFAHRAVAGIRHVFVEHDHPADGVASIRASYAFLRRLEFSP